MEEDGREQVILRDEKQIQTRRSFLCRKEDILSDVRAEISRPATLTLPVGQLAAMGGLTASLIPQKGLYRVANAAKGDILKKAKDGNFWGAMKTAEGKSKMAKLKPVSGINPAAVMMAAALVSIEKELKDISETGKQILSFLETEKESEIEADVETLYSILENYRFNRDNGHFRSGNHKMVLDIQRTARKNMISYQKKIQAALQTARPQVLQANILSSMKELQKKFKYYRLSLYTFSMASFLEIMLSENFQEDYILGIRDEIEQFSADYRKIFDRCSAAIEKKSHGSLERNVLKSVGSVSTAAGKLLGRIPVVRQGSADEFLQDNGEKIKEKAENIERSTLMQFAGISNPETGVFSEKITELNRIYNHTKEICLDQENVYLIAD